MIDLQTKSGLPIELQDDFHLKFNAPLKTIEPGVRTLDQMHKVLMDPRASSSRSEMYYMYRQVAFEQDLPVMVEHNVRYDITVIPPAMVGQEFAKTVGHYHATAAGARLAYPEIYEVLHGRALFLIQKLDQDSQHLANVFYIEAKAGDKVIYPANYGHIIVNVGEEAVVTANWVADHFESNYQAIEDRHGMAYYVVKAETGYHFLPNPHYSNIPQIQPLPTEAMQEFEIYQPLPMYGFGIQHPASLEFLTDPDKYAGKLQAIAP